MHKLSKDIILIFIAIFLLRIPPLYFTPMQSMIYTTHTVSIILLFSITIKNIFIDKRINLHTQTTMEAVLILLFLLSQSIGIINALSIETFIQRYSKVVIGIIFYFNIKLLINETNKRQLFILLKLLLVGSVITFIIQTILLLLPQTYINLFVDIIYSGVYSITKANLSASKLFDDTYFELSVPIVVYFLSQHEKNNQLKVLLWVYLFSIGLVAFASNFRYRLLSYLISLVASLIFIKKTSVTKIFLIILLCFLSISFVDPILRQVSKITLTDRLINNEEYSDSSSISWRIDMFKSSIDLANSQVFGVGLGNMYDYLKKSTMGTGNLSPEMSRSIAALMAGPHNIFFQYLGETGYIGLIAFIILLCFFIKRDYLILTGLNSRIESKVFVLMFWTLMLIVEFFPATNLTFYMLFFSLRGLI